jgi:hypothetical protein
MATYTGIESDKDRESKSGFGATGSMSGSRGMEYEEREGSMARSIERRASRLPSDMFMWAAGASILGSLALQIVGMRRERQHGMKALLAPRPVSEMRAPLASFVGMWVPSLLMLGVYNKIVKSAGWERFSR